MIHYWLTPYEKNNISNFYLFSLYLTKIFLTFSQQKNCFNIFRLHIILNYNNLIMIIFYFNKNIFIIKLILKDIFKIFSN